MHAGRKKLGRILREIGRNADRLNLPAFLVGGAVRDLLLRRRSGDRDIVTEGDPARLVQRMAGKWRGKIREHGRFGTYVLELPRGSHIDFATARTESYPSPAVLPVVQPGTITDDLFRRDFTINAVALSLNRATAGEIIDVCGGQEDLKKKRLKILHAASFRDDPTRIFRLARFSGRGFKPDRETARRVARDKKYVSLLSDERLREELLAILSEKEPLRSLLLLDKWGVLRLAFPGIKPVKGIAPLGSLPERLHYIMKGLREDRYRKLMDRLKLPRDLRRKLEVLRYPPLPKAAIDGNDLIRMGYTPGPLFKKILDDVRRRRFGSRKQARDYVFDKFRRKI